MNKDNNSHPLLTSILVVLGVYIMYQIGNLATENENKTKSGTNSIVVAKPEQQATKTPITVVEKAVSLETKVIAIAITKMSLESKAKPVAGKSGEQLFSSLGCASCHGAGGKSTVPTFPVLAGKDATYLANQLKDFQSGARPSPMMAGQAAKTTGNEQVIAEYLASQK